MSKKILCLLVVSFVVFSVFCYECCQVERGNSSPYPQSDIIASIDWDSVDSIFRYGGGSDVWPVTWASNDKLYTAWGDGYGFVRDSKSKQSMGVGFIEGQPPVVKVFDIIAPSIEFEGDGRSGIKPSSILAIENKLFMWLRNVDGNGHGCRLSESSDLGLSWSLSDWAFDELGYCVFLNFGRGYSGSRDDYVYIYSPNGSSAYDPADNFMLARVNKKRLNDRKAYEFFSGYDDSVQHRPKWSTSIERRKAVFEFPNECLRLSISYHPGLEKYLLWQQLPNSSENTPDTRFEGGFAIYEAPEPWGPWATVYFTNRWDVGPGETASIPTKWLNSDGKGFYLVYSGDDNFSIRRGKMVLVSNGK